MESHMHILQLFCFLFILRERERERESKEMGKMSRHVDSTLPTSYVFSNFIPDWSLIDYMVIV